MKKKKRILTLRFLLTRPSRDVTAASGEDLASTTFLLTRPSRDVTLFRWSPIEFRSISTHTSLAGRDGLPNISFDIFQNFYSHVPRGT